MRMTMRVTALLALGVAAIACSEDERMPIGPENPASKYCAGIGYTWTTGQCQFPDGTSCDEWAFYRGECGTEHSYCNTHGGMIAPVLADMGSFTTVTGVCTLAGAQCDEASFWQSGHCP